MLGDTVTFISTIALDALPATSALHGVDARPAVFLEREALQVELDAVTRGGELGKQFGDEPTFVLLSPEFRNGVIEVEVASRLRADAPDYARGFIGMAYRVQEGGRSFEAVYLRPMNGARLNPPPPRNNRAIQYFAYPDWKFDRLRADEPDGGFEAAADILPEQWINLRLELEERRLRALVNGAECLRVPQTKLQPASGRIGLWVDIGTEGYFRNLRVAATSPD